MVRDHPGTRYGEKEAHVVPSTEHLVPSFSWRSITKTSSRGRRLWIWSWRYMPRRNNSPLEKNSGFQVLGHATAFKQLVGHAHHPQLAVGHQRAGERDQIT